jgi:hypothetical protein
MRSAHCADGLCELAAAERVVQTPVSQQLRMVTMLYDASGIHDDDRVGVSDRGEPVGDDEAGTALP